MLGRFCLYGFLKNQQYYDPFLILAFRQMELSFFMIGVLVAFRHLICNLMEIPSGAIADLYGRRKSMILRALALELGFAIETTLQRRGPFPLHGQSLGKISRARSLLAQVRATIAK